MVAAQAFDHLDHRQCSRLKHVEAHNEGVALEAMRSISGERRNQITLEVVSCAHRYLQGLQPRKAHLHDMLEHVFVTSGATRVLSQIAQTRSCGRKHRTEREHRNTAFGFSPRISKRLTDETSSIPKLHRTPRTALATTKTPMSQYKQNVVRKNSTKALVNT